MTDNLTPPRDTPNKPTSPWSVSKLLRNTGIVLAVFTLIAGPISGITTLVNLGYSDAFLANWRTSFIKSLVVMLPTSFILMVIVDRYVKRLFLNLSQGRQNIINGLVFGFLMQSVVAGVTTANNVGFGLNSSFFSAWLQGFITALPLGIVISILMTTTIKPKLEAYMAR